MTKRKYRTDEEWLSLIQECRLSGLTDKQWCEAHQICPSNFYYQIQKFRKRACEIPESHSKTTLTAQKQEVVQVTFEQPAVSEHPQSNEKVPDPWYIWRYPRKKLVQYTEIDMTRKLILGRKVSDTQRSDIRLAI